MTIEEKRAALIEIAKENISSLYKDLTQAAQDLKTYSKQKEMSISYFSNYDIEEIKVSGYWTTMEKAVDYVNSLTEAIIKATKTLNDYKYGADADIQTEYELYSISGIIKSA